MQCFGVSFRCVIGLSWKMKSWSLIEMFWWTTCILRFLSSYRASSPTTLIHSRGVLYINSHMKKNLRVYMIEHPLIHSIRPNVSWKVILLLPHCSPATVPPVHRSGALSIQNDSRRTNRRMDDFNVEKSQLRNKQVQEIKALEKELKKKKGDCMLLSVREAKLSK